MIPIDRIGLYKIISYLSYIVILSYKYLMSKSCMSYTSRHYGKSFLEEFYYAEFDLIRGTFHLFWSEITKFHLFRSTIFYLGRGSISKLLEVDFWQIWGHTFPFIWEATIKCHPSIKKYSNIISF